MSAAPCRRAALAAALVRRALAGAALPLQQQGQLEQWPSLWAPPGASGAAQRRPAHGLAGSADGGQPPPDGWEALGVAPLLRAELRRQGKAAPTPVQAAAMAAVLSGRNVSIQSPTGTGKTLAYLLPLLTALQPWESAAGAASHARALVVAPTQDLCMQVVHAARDLMPSARRAVQPLVGGANPLRQLEALAEHRPALVVATPGRLLKTVTKQGVFKKAFPAIPWAGARGGPRLTLVLEEADRLLAMGDMRELVRALADPEAFAADEAAARRELKAARRAGGAAPGGSPPPPAETPPRGAAPAGSTASPMARVLQQFQVVLVSASLQPSALARAPAWAATRPLLVAPPAPGAGASAAAGGAAGGAQLLEPGADGAAGQPGTRLPSLPECIEHHYLTYSHGHPLSKLAQCLAAYRAEGKKVLVFCGRRTSAASTHWELEQRGAQVGVLDGAAEAQARASVLAAFNGGRLPALVVSDAFSLGLDFRAVDVVLQVESLAPSLREYVHRAGRTGRMGRPGAVVSLVKRDQVPALRRQLKRMRIAPTEVRVRECDGEGGLAVRPVAEPTAGGAACSNAFCDRASKLNLSNSCARLCGRARTIIELVAADEESAAHVAAMRPHLAYSAARSLHFEAPRSATQLPNLAALLGHASLHWPMLREVELTVELSPVTGFTDRPANAAIEALLPSLTGLPALRHLQLILTQPPNVRALAGLTQLTSLALRDRSQDDPGGVTISTDLSPLTGLTNLAALVAVGVAPADRDAPALPPGLTALVLKGMSGAMLDAWLPHAARLTALQAVDVCDYAEPRGSAAFDAFPTPALDALARGAAAAGLRQLNFELRGGLLTARTAHGHAPRPSCRLPASVARLARLEALRLGGAQLAVTTPGTGRPWRRCRSSPRSWASPPGGPGRRHPAVARCAAASPASPRQRGRACLPPPSAQVPPPPGLQLAPSLFQLGLDRPCGLGGAGAGGWRLAELAPNLIAFAVTGVFSNAECLSVVRELASSGLALESLELGLRCALDDAAAAALKALGPALSPALEALNLTWCGGPLPGPVLPRLDGWAGLKCLDLLLARSYEEYTAFDPECVSDVHLLAALAPCSSLERFTCAGARLHVGDWPPRLTPALVLGVQALLPRLTLLELVSPDLAGEDDPADPAGTDMQVARAALRPGLVVRLHGSFSAWLWSFKQLPVELGALDHGGL
ncbi:RH47 [Scenedesmus sp. PABB004]|nr:RH47 [Scenedesmus sp. PABB004]